MNLTCKSCGNTRDASPTAVCSVCGWDYGASITQAGLIAPGGRRYALLPTISTIIGSKGSAILLQGNGIAPQHARIMPDGTGSFTIEPLMGDVYVNSQQIKQMVPLRMGSSILLGNVTLTYQGPSAQGAPVVSLAPTRKHTVLPPMQSSYLPPVISPPSLNPLQQIPALSNMPQASIKGAILEGHVIIVDGPNGEDGELDFAGVIIRLMFFMIIVPFFCWQPGLIIPFILFGTRHGNKTVPTRYLRVQDANNAQHVVKMKGDVVKGMISMGDQVSFWGRLDGGNLKMSRAWNHNTKSDVKLKPVVQQERNRLLLLLVLVLFTTLGCGLAIMAQG